MLAQYGVSPVSYPSSSPYYDRFHNHTIPLLLFEPLLVETLSRTSPVGLLGMRQMLAQGGAKSMPILGRFLRVETRIWKPRIKS